MAWALSKKGFVILYAVLVAAVVAAIGIAVADLVARQIFLSNLGRQSQQAYYAANTARGCLKYWDSKGNFGEIINPASNNPKYREPSAKELQEFEDNNCGFNLYGGVEEVPSIGNEGTQFSVSIIIGGGNDAVCAQGRVVKDPTPAVGQPFSQLIVNGYNVDCQTVEGGDLPPRTVQRTLVSQ